MSKIRVQLLSLVALSLLVFGIIALAHFKTTAQQAIKPQVVKTNALFSDPVLTEIAKYRQWTRVNEKPVFVLDPTSVGS